jgi:hypothetical protein
VYLILFVLAADPSKNADGAQHRGMPEMVQNLFRQMRVKLSAERVGLSAIGWRVDRSANQKIERGSYLPTSAPGLQNRITVLP